jgi:N-methylhydantoinase A/oxoprolinase/acetone carboxylase beta subunit
MDGAGSLRVGPQSAGSEPGPACYDRGGERATVTDASVVLGYIDPDYFAAGSLKLSPALARRTIETTIARPLGLSLDHAALGIHRVLNAQMTEAIRLVSIGRGIDPRGYTLLPLGGGGPLHATALARELGIRRIAVPPHPGVLSAAGLLFAPIEHESSMAFPRLFAGLEWPAVERALADRDQACGRLMRSEGVPAAHTHIFHFADVCYVGQSYHLEIALRADAANPLETLYRDFLAAHDRIYGHSTEGAARIVNLRSIHRSTVNRPATAAPAHSEGDNASKGTRLVLTAESDKFVPATVYDRSAIAPGLEIRGPAIVEQPDTTTLIEPGWRATVVADGTLIITAD